MSPWHTLQQLIFGGYLKRNPIHAAAPRIGLSVALFDTIFLIDYFGGIIMRIFLCLAVVFLAGMQCPGQVNIEPTKTVEEWDAYLQTISYEPPVSRGDFAKGFAIVKKGMSEEQVLSVLGKPDDVRTQFDSIGLSAHSSKGVWCYGTQGHLSYPTLGCVFFNKDGLAEFIYGGAGEPPAKDLFSEEQLRGLLRVIDTTPGSVNGPYDTLTLIKVVNALQPLGKEKVLAAIDEYLRITDQNSYGARIGLFWLLRVLFDIPDGKGATPAMLEGTPSPLLPRAPVWIGHDIPLLQTGWLGGSVRKPVEEKVEYFRQHGLIRSKPLRPTDDPLSVLGEAMQLWQLTHKDENRAMNIERFMLMEQLLRLIDSVYRLPTDINGFRLTDMDEYGRLRDRPPQTQQQIEAKWEKCVRDVSLLGIKWDPQQNLYVRNDGSHLPPRPINHYRRAIWNLENLGIDAELILERYDENWVFCSLNCWGKPRTKPATLVLYGSQNPSPPLDTFQLRGGGTSEGGLVKLKPGNDASALLIFEKTTNYSPILKP
jgi:hypothetical protein